MIIACSSDEVRLTEPLDFRKFRLTLNGQTAARSATMRGIVFVDDNNALVPIDLVPTLPGRPEDGTWDAAYTDMVAKAREQGWIDATTNAIRAHVARPITRRCRAGKHHRAAASQESVCL
jgi:hypothetical protein